MHVDDLGYAALFVLENWNPNDKMSPRDNDNEPFTYLNVGTGLDIKISALAEKIASALDYNGEIVWDINKPDGTPKKQLDISRISKLGWKPKINLDEGIKLTIESFKKEFKV